MAINNGKWTRAEAIELCKEIEKFAPAYGFHVALTGGCLYKEGYRDDLDLVIYRDQRIKSDVDGFIYGLHSAFPESIGSWSYYGWRYVFGVLGRKVDLLFNYPQHP